MTDDGRSLELRILLGCSRKHLKCSIKRFMSAFLHCQDQKVKTYLSCHYWSHKWLCYTILAALYSSGITEMHQQSLRMAQEKRRKWKVMGCLCLDLKFLKSYVPHSVGFFCNLQLNTTLTPTSNPILIPEK